MHEELGARYFGWMFFLAGGRGGGNQRLEIVLLEISSLLSDKTIVSVFLFRLRSLFIV